MPLPLSPPPSPPARPLPATCDARERFQASAWSNAPSSSSPFPCAVVNDPSREPRCSKPGASRFRGETEEESMRSHRSWRSTRARKKRRHRGNGAPSERNEASRADPVRVPPCSETKARVGALRLLPFPEEGSSPEGEVWKEGSYRPQWSRSHTPSIHCP